MSVSVLPLRFAKRRAPRKPPRLEPEIVFKTFVRALQRLREPPHGGGPAAIGAAREKA
ncbi:MULTISPECIES: hypothetical protein [Methylosinus]|uniref:hypothetical protein n=1 Tax=Methylosinus TaxID=425 RepID=UPI001304AF40|nr:MULTISPECIES: hypothetical protein [Methylosinus]MBU3887454.1 hypothetical protein [Methylosinus sp. KRF6]